MRSILTDLWNYGYNSSSFSVRFLFAWQTGRMITIFNVMIYLTVWRKKACWCFVKVLHILLLFVQGHLQKKNWKGSRDVRYGALFHITIAVEALWLLTYTADKVHVYGPYSVVNFCNIHKGCCWLLSVTLLVMMCRRKQ